VVNNSNHNSLDSVNYVLNGKKVTSAEFNKQDPAKIVSINIVSSAEAKRLLTAADNLVFDNNNNIVFVNTSDSDVGKKLMEKLTSSQIRLFNVQGGARAGVFEGKGLTIYQPDTSLARKATVFAKTFKGNTIYRAVPDSVIARTYNRSATGLNGIGMIYTPAEALKLDKKLLKLDTVKIAFSKPAELLKLNSVYKATDAATLNKLYFSAEGNAALAKTYSETLIDGDVFLTNKSVSRISDKMVVIDGKEATESDMKKISAFDIDRVEVRSDAATIKKHGAKAKKGVVYIYTKKAK
jgi:bla regulator protein BlaR1